MWLIINALSRNPQQVTAENMLSVSCMRNQLGEPTD